MTFVIRTVRPFGRLPGTMRKVPAAGTRERILKAAESLFGDCGYAGTRLHEIARLVGIQKASLFHYFASKEELYRSVLTEGYGETERRIRSALEREGSPLDNLSVLVEAYVDMVAEHPARTKILLRQSLGDAPPGPWTEEAERLMGLVANFIVKWQGAKRLAPADAYAVVLGVIGTVAFFFASAPAITPAWLGDPNAPATIERIKRYVVEVVQRALTDPATARGTAPALAYR